jgi:hypothetical protein
VSANIFSGFPVILYQFSWGGAAGLPLHITKKTFKQDLVIMQECRF